MADSESDQEEWLRQDARGRRHSTEGLMTQPELETFSMDGFLLKASQDELGVYM